MTDLWISKLPGLSADGFGVPSNDVLRVYIWCYKNAIVVVVVAAVEAALKAAEETVIVVVVASPSHVSVPRCTIAMGLKVPVERNVLQ